MPRWKTNSQDVVKKAKEWSHWVWSGRMCLQYVLLREHLDVHPVTGLDALVFLCSRSGSACLTYRVKFFDNLCEYLMWGQSAALACLPLEDELNTLPTSWCWQYTQLWQKFCAIAVNPGACHVRRTSFCIPILLVWLMEVATRAKWGCRRTFYEHGMLQDLQLWQKIFVEAVCIVNTIMLVKCLNNRKELITSDITKELCRALQIKQHFHCL